MLLVKTKKRCSLGILNDVSISFDGMQHRKRGHMMTLYLWLGDSCITDIDLCRYRLKFSFMSVETGTIFYNLISIGEYNDRLERKLAEKALREAIHRNV